MTITAVEAIPFAIPYRKPLKSDGGEVHIAERVLLRAHTDAGLTGTAEAPPRPFTYGETHASIVAVIRQIFEPQLLGMAPTRREAAHAKLNRTVADPTAKAAIGMALCDIVGQAADRPVSELLCRHGEFRTVHHMLGCAPPPAVVEEAQRVRDTYGITTFKVKVGRRPYQLDVDVCRTLREAFGDSVELYVDGNRAWTASESARVMGVGQGGDGQSDRQPDRLVVLRRLRLGLRGHHVPRGRALQLPRHERRPARRTPGGPRRGAALGRRVPPSCDARA
ncbi:enolase C-terminal domain-like protein [Streptomyces sp. NPDC048641]|uniref:mandelate racemase/muconate lactonizing enzyme family protein n=1 Tax=Streptomyces sp. NPDC048641 TaxID=3154825 RepID=UPI0034121292